ncbi:MAG: UDP-N-acetylglucosamine 1-carboxyvinyltransferase [Massiliimalia sp.]
MSKLVIEGGHRLCGSIPIQGAKNSCLPILAATLLGGGKSTIRNCPRLSDVDAAVEILRYLGCEISREDDILTVDSSNAAGFMVPEELMQEMRSSIVFLGPILARMGKAVLSAPGGCELGPRPIDLHLDALRRLGAVIEEQHGFLCCTAPQGLKGAKISLSFPSVGATENIMLAAVLAKGRTVVHNAAEEPEIVDLADYLNSRGAKISGAGKSTIVINGVKKLHDIEHQVIPDRIVAATYLCAGLITGGEVQVDRVHTMDLESVIPVLEQAGAKIQIGPNSLRMRMDGRPKRVRQIRTMPYPGFPTDAQAPVMAALSVADGTSVFVENIFESRYKHAIELNRMGADIKMEGRVAVCTGVPRLMGAAVRAEDLRGGAALVLAGLQAEGVTKVSQVHHIDRGYEEFEKNLNRLGAHVWREGSETV